MIKGTLKSLMTVFLAACSLLSSGTSYFVDSRKGKDTNFGSSISEPWKTLSRVNKHRFNPGDTVCFLRGSEWVGELTINSGGKESRPVVFTAYGEGNNPVIKNPGINRATAIKINADRVVVENFLVKESHQAGIAINKGADYNIVRNNEAIAVGIGISVSGTHNLITKNFAHDLSMVVNNEGGDNDYGAVGIWLFASDNEVCYNRMVNCKAPSYDYGFDGGVVEFYGDVDNCYIHHNSGENCVGSFEVGGGNAVTLSRNRVTYNIFINNGGSGGFHVGGKFGVNYEAWTIENNTFIDTCQSTSAISFWGGAPSPSAFAYRNNIFYIPNCQSVSNLPGFIHENNLFYTGDSINPGIIPGPGDKIGDPLFIDLSKNDFHLKAESPAIDGGQNLGYIIDFENNKVPTGSAPDIGAYEYTGKTVKRN
jgi:hypothetical protein